MTELAKRSVLLVGVGGLGSPAAIALARACIGTLGLADDDVVEEANLHRQILFGEDHVGAKKTEAAARAIASWGAGSSTRVVVHDTRLLPSNALELVRAYDLVVEGSDNFATKFLVADACALARVRVVHGAAVRWHGTALAVGAGGRPCYRCLFEDVPRGDSAPNCAEAGVMGPMVGVLGAVQADLALALLADPNAGGMLVTFDAKTDVLRRRRIHARPGCELCGLRARIRSVDGGRYAAACAADPLAPAGVVI